MLLKLNASIYSKGFPPRLPFLTVNNIGYSSLFFPIFDNDIRFFTCNTVPVLSFNYYVSAFDKYVWISIIVSGIVLAIFWNFHIHFCINKQLKVVSWIAILPGLLFQVAFSGKPQIDHTPNFASTYKEINVDFKNEKAGLWSICGFSKIGKNRRRFYASFHIT